MNTVTVWTTSCVIQIIIVNNTQYALFNNSAFFLKGWLDWCCCWSVTHPIYVIRWRATQWVRGQIICYSHGFIVWNELVHIIAGIQGELGRRVDQRVGHAERMDEYLMARRVLMAEVNWVRVQGRPRLGWMATVSGLGQQMDDCGRRSRMRERQDEAESPYAYLDDWVSSGHFCLVRVFFLTDLRSLVARHLGWDAVAWCGLGKAYSK